MFYPQRQRLTNDCVSDTVANSSVLRNSFLNWLLNDSAKPFRHADPGSMYSVVVVLFFCPAPEVMGDESGPLSLWINARTG